MTIKFLASGLGAGLVWGLGAGLVAGAALESGPISLWLNPEYNEIHKNKFMQSNSISFRFNLLTPSNVV